jgi:hypothetical protein
VLYEIPGVVGIHGKAAYVCLVIWHLFIIQQSINEDTNIVLTTETI